MSSLDFGEILNKWNDVFDNDISSGTSNYKLIKTSILPGKDTTKVVLIFEQEVVIDDRDTYSLNKYRVLLYDITMDPVLLRSSEFQYIDQYVTGAWFIDNRLYVARTDSKGLVIIDGITNTGKVEVLKLGYGVMNVTTNQKGDFIVGYDCGNDDPEKREVIYVYKKGNEENDVLECDDAISCEALSVDSHDSIWSYTKPYNYIQHTAKKEFKTYYINYTGFNGIGVSDNGKVLVGSMGYRLGGNRLVAFKLDSDDAFSESEELAISVDDETVRKFDTCEFNGNKMLLRVNDKLYMVNINELTWKELENSNTNKESKKKRK